MPLAPNEDIPEFTSLPTLNEFLKYHGCRRCDLGFQKNINGCCVSKGPLDSKLMIIGEAPGRDEDSTRKPFTGPAGQLLDRIWRSVGLDTKDWYMTNVVLCRPVAPYGYGKENMTPKTEQKKLCNSYMWQQIQLLNPEIIVALGAHATAALVNRSAVRMGDYRGRLLNSGRFRVFPMLHPACILHAQRDNEKWKLYREQTWTDVQRLKEILVEENLV